MLTKYVVTLWRNRFRRHKNRTKIALNTLVTAKIRVPTSYFQDIVRASHGLKARRRAGLIIRRPARS